MGARYSAGDLLQRRTLTRDDSIPNYVLIFAIEDCEYYGVFWFDTWDGLDSARIDWIEKYYTLVSTLDT